MNRKVRIFIGVGGTVLVLAILLTALFSGHNTAAATSDDKSAGLQQQQVIDLQQRVIYLQKQVIDLQKQIGEKQNQITDLQCKLDNAGRVNAQRPASVAPPAVYRMPAAQAPVGPAPTVTHIRPAVEIQDDIKDLRRKIREEETELALTRERARMFCDNPSQNIVWRAKIAGMEEDIGDMRNDMAKLVAELQKVSPQTTTMWPASQ